MKSTKTNRTKSDKTAVLPPISNLNGLPEVDKASLDPAESKQRIERPFSAFGSISQFKDAQRMAVLLARSAIVPDNYRGESHIGDCVIALEIANRIGASVLAVMQNLCLVQGRPGWSSQFLISCVNATKRFSPLRYQMTGTRGEDSWGCVAWATDKTGQELKSPEVTIKMAKEEGWYYRNDSKWRTMPDLMLCYRSATFFIRLYAPEITMGIQTAEEVGDIGLEGNGQSSRPIFDTGQPKARFEPKSTGQPSEKDPIPSAPPGGSAHHKLNGASALQPAAVGCPAAAPLAIPEPNLPDCQYHYLKALNGLIALSQHSEADVLRFLYNSRKCDEAFVSLVEVAEKQPNVVIWAHDSWKSVDQEISRLKKGQAV